MTWRRFTRFFRRRRRSEELASEIDSYIEHEFAANLERGLGYEESQAAAIRKFGNRTAYREVAYEMNTVQIVDSIWRNLVYGARQLRRSPGFTITAILSLALGIGANTAVFQLLNAVRLRNLPVRNPQELVQVVIEGGNRGFGSSPGHFEVTNPLWEQIRKRQEAFSGVFAWGAVFFDLGEGVSARPIQVLYASGGMFPTLGVSAVRGRLFGEEDDRAGCAAGPVVISHAMWQSEFGGQDSAIGARIVLNKKPMQVIGVAPAEFFGLEIGRGFDLAIPNCARGAFGRILEMRHVWTLNVMGRLKPGWTVGRAAEYMKTASPAWFAEVVPTDYDAKALERWKQFRYTAVPGGTGVSELRRQYERSLWLLLAITGMVLLLACANLANLLLARAAAREREMAIRLALGASRMQIVSQLFTESLLLAAMGALFAAGLAQVMSHALVRFLSTRNTTVLLDLGFDFRVLAFVSAAALLTCLVFGLAPALKSSRADAFTAMKSGGRAATASRRQFSLQSVMIVFQLAVSLMLVVGALLFVRSFHNLMSVDAGFRQDGLAFTYINFGALRPARDAVRPIQRAMLEKIRAIPGIESAATSSHTPLTGNSWSLEVQRKDGTRVGPQFTWVSPSYWKTMQIPLRAGRDFDERDSATSSKVLLVNETFVRRIFDGENPVGRTVHSLAEPGYPDVTYQVIGVVGDTRYADLRAEAPPIAYAPELQNPQWGPGMAIVTRSSIPTGQAMAEIHRVISQNWPAGRMEQVELRAMVNERLLRERLLAWVSGFFGILAFALATLGLYGVISYIAASRRNEIGIRIALGANRRAVLALFLRQLGVLLAFGLSAGALCSLVLTKGAAALLFGVQANDPVTLAAAAAALAVTGVAATLIPSSRAARLDPADCLRTD